MSFFSNKEIFVSNSDEDAGNIECSSFIEDEAKDVTCISDEIGESSSASDEYESSFIDDTVIDDRYVVSSDSLTSSGLVRIYICLFIYLNSNIENEV